ncbi:MAG TPA: response regulator transcription factor, partial [Candidatus Dormibacteraeota bacterium]|nr:response regulator transcription factor [Candidatus Dormibacteraeota bacterium]
MADGPRRRVLIVEDDLTMLTLLSAVCEAGGHEPVTATDGVEALEAASTGACDLVLLDMNLPGMSGLEVCRRMRRDGRREPIIVVTASTDTVDAVVALEVGADDYVRKPFHARELAARIARHLRRREPQTPGNGVRRMEFPGLVIDPIRRQVWRDGAEVRLTITEFNLLHTLAERPKAVVTRRELMQRIWNQDAADSRTIDAHIYRLRRKV